MDIRDLFDGELHELRPGDWVPVEQKVLHWVPIEGAKNMALETPDLGWVPADLSYSEQLTYGVAEGWATVAVMLQNLSRALGGRPVCYQKGKRYFFQHKIEEDEE